MDKRLFAVISVLVLASMMLAACGGSAPTVSSAPAASAPLIASESEPQVPLYITIMTPVNDLKSTNLEYNSSSPFCYGSTVQIGKLKFKVGVAGEKITGYTFEQIGAMINAAGEITCGDYKLKYLSDDSSVTGSKSSGMNRFEFGIVP